MRCGDRWSRGNEMEATHDESVMLLIYLVRRDKPFPPWSVSVPRSELRIESEAIVDYKRDPNSFGDLADAGDANLARHGVANRHARVDDDLKVGTQILEFWNGMLDPCQTTGPVKEHTVSLRRIGLGNAQMVKPIKDLFIDPFGGAADCPLSCEKNGCCVRNRKRRFDLSSSPLSKTFNLPGRNWITQDLLRNVLRLQTVSTKRSRQLIGYCKWQRPKSQSQQRCLASSPCRATADWNTLLNN